MPKWEYKVSPVTNPDRLEDVLDHYGKQGWELVTVLPPASLLIGSPLTLLLKRPEGS